MNKRLIILEIANNHMGDLTHAKKIIKKYSSITKKYKEFNFALKFQLRDRKTFIDKSFRDSKDKQIERFRSTFLSKQKWNELIKFSKKYYDLACTGFDESSVSKIFNDKKFKYIKIASCSANDWPLIEQIYKCYKKKPKQIFCSLAGLNIDEIDAIYSYFKNRNVKINFFYCVGIYPTKNSDLNLKYFKFLEEKYGNKITGFSTHEMPNEKFSGSVAIGLGVKVFEKHIGLKDNQKNYDLNDYSVGPEEFENWLKNISNAIIVYGSKRDRDLNTKKEKEKLKTFQRGVYIKSDLNSKKKITSKDVYYAFPLQENQLSANEFSKHNIYKTKKKLSEGLPLLKKNLEIKNNYSEVKIIRDKIRNFLKNKKITIPTKPRLEISHHYGIEKFYKFGITMITVINKIYCKKLIIILPNQKHPAQFHKKKQESFFILYGKVNLKINKKNLNLNPGDLKTIKPGEIHEFSSKTGAIIEELSTTSMINDSFYIDKSIHKNKNRKSFITL